ncbi:MAG: NTP transferase domain-containing protein [candidate division Zixibacteria bacterium]|nr:NTP transferase domain-containing protein [candidate division Zixibacteria bacterium]
MKQKKAAVVLAAGKGKRMKSDLPKVLHEINGRPIIQILLDRILPIGFDHVVLVIGHKGELVREALASYPVAFVTQSEQLGTGHAVSMAREELAGFEGTTLIAAGDVPFLSRASIENLFEVHARTKAAATCLSAIFDDPTGYGRIIRKPGTDLMEAIVEHKDASSEVLAIKEINTGTFCFDNRLMFEAISQIGRDNAQGEYYLTDAVKILRGKGYPVSVVRAANPDEVRGVNSVDQLRYLADKFSAR